MREDNKMACIPYFSDGFFKSPKPIIGRKYKENRKRVERIATEAIETGALGDSFVVVDGLQVIVSFTSDGRTCYFCNDKEYAPRVKVEILDPKKGTEEKYILHDFHFD